MFVFTAFHYPELNTSHHLRSTWVRTGESTSALGFVGNHADSFTVCVTVCLCGVSVLLGVQDQLVAERSFKARLERRLALLLEEGLQTTSRRRLRRATAVGNNSLQVCT